MLYIKNLSEVTCRNCSGSFFHSNCSSIKILLRSRRSDTRLYFLHKQQQKGLRMSNTDEAALLQAVQLHSGLVLHRLSLFAIARSNRNPEYPWELMFIFGRSKPSQFQFSTENGENGERIPNVQLFKKLSIKLSRKKSFTCSHRMHYFLNKCNMAFEGVYIVTSQVLVIYLKYNSIQ